MIVVSMTNCPPKLRGDLTKWLMEINTGVYVGQVSARVREALWKRICENIGCGQATMVFSTNNEQHLDFYVHNSSWIPVDLDGIKLMKRPENILNTGNTELATGFSNAAKQRHGKKRRRDKTITSYVLLDIETTGLSVQNDEILEIGIVEISAGRITEQQSYIIKVDSIPAGIEKLTGIDMQLVSAKGGELSSALEQVFNLIEEKNVLIYNAEFDLGFLKCAAEKTGMSFPYIYVTDVMELSKKHFKNPSNYKLETIAGQLGINNKQEHRAIADCLLMNKVYLKLNEKH